MALEDAGDLRRRVGRDDQAKLDEYLESVRAVERRDRVGQAKHAIEAGRPRLPRFPRRRAGSRRIFASTCGSCST